MPALRHALLMLGPPLLCAALLIASLADRSLMEQWFIHTSYYAIFAIVVTALFIFRAFLLERGVTPEGFWTSHRWTLIAAALLTLCVFISVPPFYRVLADETNLLAVSRSLAFDKTVFNTTMGMWYFDNFHPIFSSLPKAPLLYPFVVHLFHVAFGYDYHNGFWANALLLFGLLLLIGVYARRFFRTPGVLAAMLLILAHPVVTLSATSAGFDFMSLAAIILCGALLYEYLRLPSPLALAALWMALVLCANVRYENPLFIAVASIVLLATRSIRASDMHAMRYLYAASPLFFLPWFWQFVLSQGKYEDKGLPLFRLEYATDQITSFFQALFAFDLYMPYAAGLVVIGCAALPYLIFLGLRHRAVLPKRVWVWSAIAALAVSAQVAMFMVHFFGKAEHPASFRFFQFVAVVFALLPAAVAIAHRSRSGYPLLVLALGTLLIYHPVAIEARLTHTSTLVRGTERVYRYLEVLGEKNIVVITDRPGLFTAMDRGAVSFEYAAVNAEQLRTELVNRLISRILVLQWVDYQTGHVTPPLPDRLPLRAVAEFQYEGTAKMRISEVDVGALPTP